MYVLYSIYDVYKRSLVKHFYNIGSEHPPPPHPTISDLGVWRNVLYNLRGHNKAVVSWFSTYLWEILFVIEVLYCGIMSQIILMIHVVLNNFIERQNLIPHLGKSDLRSAGS